jgi:LmbE family N-acetylglucosaminyl deacetylase
MRYEHLDQLQHAYDHVYISPHLDDAVLSCGGALACHVANGARALVVTLCTAVPPPDGPFSDLAHEFHGEWGLSPAEVVTARLREDAAAMARLGVDYMYAGMMDALYRHPQAYNSRAAIFGTPAADDPLRPPLMQFLRRLRQRMPDAMLYVPLGAGKHVDHQIVYMAALDALGAGVAFYEEMPYILQPGVLQQRLNELDAPFVASIINIDHGMLRKVRAAAAYESQLDVLFGGPAAMEQQLQAYAEDLRPEAGTYGERLWLRVM